MIYIVGAFSCWRLSLSFIYGQEIVEDRVQNASGSLFMVSDAVVMIISSVFIKYCTGEWVALHTMFILMILSSFAIYYAIPESPKYLV